MDYGVSREILRIIFQRQNIGTFEQCALCFFLSVFCCVMVVWHSISFNQAFTEAWFECLSFRDSTVLALPATSSVLPDCWKKRLCYYSTSDWNAPSVKTSACADALALNSYHQLQMPLPTPLLRGFNNFLCVRRPEEEKSCVHSALLGRNYSFSPLWRCETLHKQRWSVSHCKDLHFLSVLLPYNK